MMVLCSVPTNILCTGAAVLTDAAWTGAAPAVAVPAAADSAEIALALSLHSLSAEEANGATAQRRAETVDG